MDVQPGGQAVGVQWWIQVLGEGGGGGGGRGHGWWVWLLVSGLIRKAVGGAVGFWPDTKNGGRGGGYHRILGGPGYCTVVEFMRTGINRQRVQLLLL